MQPQLQGFSDCNEYSNCNERLQPNGGNHLAGSPMEQCAMMMMNFMMHMCKPEQPAASGYVDHFQPSPSKRRAFGGGSPGEQSTLPKQEQLALPDQPQAASVKAAVPEASTPPMAGEDQLKLPTLKAFTFPDSIPES